jgi:SAM-dependent methyltransferase
MRFAGARGFRPDDLAGKLVLDVGCGMGRFAEVPERWGAHVVGIGFSPASEVVAKNLEDRSATISQSDVFQLPFAPGSFDFIYSIGVLLRSKQAVKVLPNLLKPGGRNAVWLYNFYRRWYRMSDIYPRVTRPTPSKMLHNLCHAVIPSGGMHQVLRKVPLIGKRASDALAWLISMSFQQRRHLANAGYIRLLLGQVSVQAHFEEVLRCFENRGLEDLRAIEQFVAVQGRRLLVGQLLPASEALEVQLCAE